ncbi:MAG: NAD(P)-dependent oxidoreductase [Desulfobacca sp.]|nr:NAD(P)-dependent oxidoreductase [Desulfobacca sp.]
MDQPIIANAIKTLPGQRVVSGVVTDVKSRGQQGGVRVNRTVLITGSTRGIGLATAAEFLNQGDRVVIFCRHKKHLKEATEYLLTFGEKENVLALVGNVQKARDVKKIVNRCLKHFERIDILINNAGAAAYKPIEETTEKEWDLIIDTNLKGTFLFLRQVIPVMKNQGTGIIINISSGLGIEGATNFSAYCASKFGVIGLTRTLADEIALPGIRVYAVLPGAVDTKLLKIDRYHFGRELSEIMRSEETAQGKKSWVYAAFPSMGDTKRPDGSYLGPDPSELMSPEHVARQIYKVAKGEKKSGTFITVFS